MRSRQWKKAAALVAWAAAACGADEQVRLGPGAGAPDAMPTVDAPSPECETNATCEAHGDGRPYCANDGVCVGCRDHGDCAQGPWQLVCDPASRACRHCVEDTDCPSGVCDVDEGSCIAENLIYYVDDDAPCGGNGSRANPACTIAEAMQLLVDAPRGVLRIAPGRYEFPPPTTLSQPLWVIGSGESTIIGPGVTCLDPGIISTLRLRGVRFRGCGTAVLVSEANVRVLIDRNRFEDNAIGIDCRFGAICVVLSSTFENTATPIVASSDSHLVVLDSVVRGSRGDANGITCGGATCRIERTRVIGAARAGIVVKSPSSFRLINNAVLENGTDTAATYNGGIVLDTGAAERVFAHNTVYGNRAKAGIPSGVVCAASTVLWNSILWGNSGAQTVAPCEPRSSAIDQEGFSTMNGNFRLDPRLASTTPGAIDPHLAPDSPCIDRAEPTDLATMDLDRQARPAGPRSDVGADERQ